MENPCPPEEPHPAGRGDRKSQVRFGTATYYVFARTSNRDRDEFTLPKAPKIRGRLRPKGKFKTSEKHDINSLKQVIKEHFAYCARERVAYKELVETFLPYEEWFKSFNQRDVIIAIQNVFKGVIAKPSLKESIVFLNLTKKNECNDLGEVIEVYKVNLEPSDGEEAHEQAEGIESKHKLFTKYEHLDGITRGLEILNLGDSSKLQCLEKTSPQAFNPFPEMLGVTEPMGDSNNNNGNAHSFTRSSKLHDPGSEVILQSIPHVECGVPSNACNHLTVNGRKRLNSKSDQGKNTATEAKQSKQTVLKIYCNHQDLHKENSKGTSSHQFTFRTKSQGVSKVTVRSKEPCPKQAPHNEKFQLMVNNKTKESC